MRNFPWSLAALFSCTLPTACADPCIDDGLGQAICPAQDTASATEGSTDATTMTVTDTMGTATMSTATVGMTGSQTGQTDTLDGTATDSNSDTDTDTDTTPVTDTDSATDTDTSGGSLWCVDADGDGFGDPDQCQQSDGPVPGSVENGDDCDDGNEDTFPGAAPNDDPTACMQDEDGDDWGDSNPPPGVDAGTDCIDDNANVFPGAAENEIPPDLCAEDADGDGWGNDNPPPGADPGNDCADDNADIFPGAAENETPPDLCAEDADGDGWGNDNPPPGVDAGSDCDDTNPAAFPGAAPNENPPDLCTIDADGDGWGDANPPGGGAAGGSDCYDTNPDLNPDTVQLTAFMPYNAGALAPRTINTVNAVTGALAPFVTLLTPMGGIPNANLVTGAFNENMEIFANDLTAAQLQSVDYTMTCGIGIGELAPIGMPYGTGGVDIVCGLEFGNNGDLYGISHNADTLITFNPVSGQVINSVPIMVGMNQLNINSCGMARDCGQGRLLVANGGNQNIYSVDELTGAATLVRNLTPYLGPGAWTPVGLEYDPVSRMAFLSTGNVLYSVDLENDVPPVLIGNFAQPVSNLQNLPICMP